MAKKNKKERQDAHEAFEQRLVAASKTIKFEIAAEHIPLAADFIHANYHTLENPCLLEQGVLSKIALGRFTPSAPQKNEITRVAQAINWAPPEA